MPNHDPCMSLPHIPLFTAHIRLVDIKDRAQAGHVVQQLGQPLARRAIPIRFDRTEMSKDGLPVGTVFVCNLAWEVKDEILNHARGEYGPVHAEVMTSMMGRSRGFGVLKFSSIVSEVLPL